MHWKRALRDQQATLLSVSAARRPLPEFLIIGAMKAGTTSLYSWLCEHPAVLPARRKEVHYFDREPLRSLAWYRSFFATGSQRAAVRAEHGHAVAGEATPAYLATPGAAACVAAVLPDVRAVALLREPTSRAWSHYQHECRAGREDRPFADAVAADLAAPRPAVGPAGGIVGRGRYVDALVPWRAALGERLLIVISEDMYQRPADTLGGVLSHLGLSAGGSPTLPRLNTAGSRAKPDVGTLAVLRTAYEPANQELAEFLGRALPW